MKKYSIIILLFFLSFCSLEKELQKKIQNELENISPECAIIKVEMISVSENSNQLILSTKVEDVYGYGSSTTPINNGTILEFQIDKNEFSKNLFDRKNLIIEVQSSEEEMLGSQTKKWILKKVIN